MLNIRRTESGFSESVGREAPGHLVGEGLRDEYKTGGVTGPRILVRHVTSIIGLAS